MPDGAGATGDPHRVERFLAALRPSATPDGFVPFDRFMEVALYGEGVGFYDRPDSPFGRTGDYYTAALVSPLFGECVAERVLETLRGLGNSFPLRLVELGPGDGTLGETIVRALGRDADLRGRTEYALVERARASALRAYERVSAAAAPGGVRVTAASGLGADGPFSGVVLANEVLDAQPCRRLKWTGVEWLETGVRLGDDRWVPDERPLTARVPGAKLPEGVAAGSILEVSPAAEAIAREVGDHLTDGLFLALDYGMEESELLAAHPHGTLAAVRQHRSGVDPYAQPGDADLSVFVNFSRFRFAAKSAGLRELAFRSQAEALGEWGFPRLFEEAVRAAPSSEEEVRIRLAAKNLLFGFERFRALELVPEASFGKFPSAT